MVHHFALLSIQRVLLADISGVPAVADSNHLLERQHVLLSSLFRLKPAPAIFATLVHPAAGVSTTAAAPQPPVTPGGAPCGG